MILDGEGVVSEIFPLFDEPRSLTVVDVHPYSWDEQMSMVCTQGLINRIKPRIYLLFDDYVDRLWLSIHGERYGITYTEARDLFEVIRSYADELDGFVVYDDEMLHSANIGMTYCSVHNAVPASPSVADRLSEMGLRKIADFRGRWKNRLEAYEWGLENLVSECNSRIVGSMCVDQGWLKPRHHVRDYLVATKAFTFDLSTKIRDRKENELFDRILGRFSSLGVVLGWHCCRDTESEAVARAAKNGFFVLCNLSSPNLSVYSGIKAKWKLRQKHISKGAITVENKVYVAFVQSDGDAIWAMNNFQNRNWLDGQRGVFPYTWEIQPLLLDLAPGILEYYYQTATHNDYFIAGPSGAGYTGPTLNKRQDDFLEQTKNYFELCDLRSGLIMNRDPRVCYQELEDPRLPSVIIRKLDMCFGFLHGYRGSAFVPAIFVNNVPYIHTAQYVSGSSDIFKEITKFGEGCETRPLFVSIHVREDTRMPTLRGAIDNLDPQVYRVVKLDEFMLTLQKAKEEGRFTEIFPEIEFLKESIEEQGQSSWEDCYKRIIRLEGIVDLKPGQMLSEFNTGGYDFSQEQLPDLLGYDAIETMLHLIRAALNMKGVHVNYLERSIKDFLIEYSNLPDVGVAKDVYELWQNWEQVRNDLNDMRLLTRRVIELAETLNLLSHK